MYSIKGVVLGTALTCFYYQPGKTACVGFGTSMLYSWTNDCFSPFRIFRDDLKVLKGMLNNTSVFKVIKQLLKIPLNTISIGCWVLMPIMGILWIGIPLVLYNDECNAKEALDIIIVHQESQNKLKT